MNRFKNPTLSNVSLNTLLRYAAIWYMALESLVNWARLFFLNSIEYSHNYIKIMSNGISIHIIKQSPPPRLSVCLSVCLLAINSKTTARIFMGFSLIDRVIHPENSGI